MRRIYKKRGLTLIELLIVIALIGILATAAVASLNPGEKFAQARDAGRISNISQLGLAMESYKTIKESNAYPETSDTWQNLLVDSKEIKVPVIVSPAPNNCTVHPGIYNICYTPFGSNSEDAAIWTMVESENQKTLANCTGTDVAAFAWIASLGQVVLRCVVNPNTVPSPQLPPPTPTRTLTPAPPTASLRKVYGNVTYNGGPKNGQPYDGTVANSLTVTIIGSPAQSGFDINASGRYDSSNIFIQGRSYTVQLNGTLPVGCTYFRQSFTMGSSDQRISFPLSCR